MAEGQRESDRANGGEGVPRRFNQTRVSLELGIVAVAVVGIVGAALGGEASEKILGLATAVCVGLLAIGQNKTSKTSEQAAEVVAEVKVKSEAVAADVVEKLGRIQAKTDANGETIDIVHALSNSTHGAALRSNAELARWKAERDDNPTYAKEAEEAERLYREHVSKQAAADVTLSAAADKPKQGG